MKVTAETITDEQIRRLADVMRDTSKNNRMIAIGLFGPTQRELDLGITQCRAKGYLAAAWNARHGGEP